MKKMKLPNGYGSVYKLSGKRRRPFVAMVTTGYEIDHLNGKIRQKRSAIGYYEKQSDAWSALVKYNDNPYDLDSKKLKLCDIFRLYTETSDYINLSSSTKQAHDVAYNKLHRIHKVKFASLNSVILQDEINLVANTPSTKNQIKKLLSNLYSYAEKYDIVSKNYAKYIEVGDKNPTVKRRIYSDDEVRKLWDNMPTYKWIDSILFMLYTGFRVSEMLEIRIDDIDLDNLVIIGGKKTDAGKNRIMPIHNDIVDIVKSRYNKNNEFLFVGEKGNSMSQRTYREAHYTPIMNQLGLKGSGCHDTRHTFCSKLDNYNINQVTIKRLMGHSTKDITERYTHKNIDDLRDAINLIKY